ncbi:hypothetical protein [Alicyclobacillus sp. SO9]|uniref:hypothetical protein n=1 Tax=Alicyclobacillus sp. SO9 TaxID=2665646 RepID=UPI0018E71A67|nr:hypothetical protein [Alicyclobacillus sp. SO9]QQE79086.1 hypothetical protein GI364_00745 [Alicyclobacillus sp. SO9]
MEIQVLIGVGVSDGVSARASASWRVQTVCGFKMNFGFERNLDWSKFWIAESLPLEQNFGLEQIIELKSERFTERDFT